MVVSSERRRQGRTKSGRRRLNREGTTASLKEKERPAVSCKKWTVRHLTLKSKPAANSIERERERERRERERERERESVM
jgi:hypothetical protein